MKPTISQNADEFYYGDDAIAHLKRADPVLGAHIDRLGVLKRKAQPDLFRALAWSILGQQVSTASQEAAMAKFDAKTGGASPEKIIVMPDEDFKACGVSSQKTRYLKNIAQACLHQGLNKGELEKLSDDEVIERLCKIKGVGIWTAEMALIFCLMRPDVLSFGDLGIRRGISRLHGLEGLNQQTFDKYKKLYSPYGSAAALYIWEIGAGK